MQPRTGYVVVVGAGIAGLSAAHAILADDHGAGADAPRVTVLEAADRVGGVLHGVEVGGQVVDVGAESMLYGNDDARWLVSSLGLDDRITHPATTSASVWSRGRLVPLPKGTLMGVPRSPRGAGDVLTEDEAADLREASTVQHPPVHLPDLPVGPALAERVGRAVVDRLVEPLLGGVYAGRVDDLSMRSTMPRLWTAVAAGEPVLDAVAAIVPEPREPDPDAPPRHVFFTIEGGTNVVPRVLHDRLLADGADVRTGWPVERIEPLGDRYRVVGPHGAIEADAVVVALPAPQAAGVLAAFVPAAAHALVGVELASMAVVTMAFDRTEIGALPGSGFLVPAAEGRDIKAATFSSGKWPWVDALSPDTVWLRTSLGRAGEAEVLDLPDEQILDLALADLAAALGRELPTPVDTHVQRWVGGLPQYGVGHADRVETVRAAVGRLPGLAVAGATYDGVGIAATIGSARAAARIVRDHLAGAAAGTLTEGDAG